jgi:hypothetical protein
LCSAGWFVLVTNATTQKSKDLKDQSDHATCTQSQAGFWVERAEHLKCLSDTFPILHMYGTAVVFVTLGIHYYCVSFLIL